MKHSEVLKRYVNTGSQIPEKQYERLSQSLQTSYMRMRGVVGYEDWEFKILSDDERIRFIEKKGKKLISNDVENLLKHSKNKDLIATKIIDVIGKEFNPYLIESLVKFTTDNIAVKIIYLKGEKLPLYEINKLLKHSKNKDLIATKIIEVKGKELDYYDIRDLLKYSENKELIKKTLLQNGFDYKLINDVISRGNIDTPLIPDNYQEMLNEIRRIKQIMG
jgi:hypothetical protein